MVLTIEYSFTSKLWISAHFQAALSRRRRLPEWVRKWVRFNESLLNIKNKMASLSSIFPVGAGYNAGGTGLSRETKKLTFWPEPLVKSVVLKRNRATRLAGCGKTRGQTNLSPTANVVSASCESMLWTDPSVPAFFRNLLIPDLTGARPKRTASAPSYFRIIESIQ